MRPGMYIGKLGNGSSADDGVYILLKEIIDNSIDEYVMGYGKKIDVKVNEHSVYVRDYGRGIPLSKVEDCVSKINTGGKYDSKERIGGTLASVLFLLSQGVQIFRVHNVREIKQGILVFEKIYEE